MPSIDFALISCRSCGHYRKIQPEKLYLPGSFEFPQLQPLDCPLCGGRMFPCPEFGAPSWNRGLFPMSADVEWMA